MRGYLLAAGYRSIDTAAIYGNEEGVGQAIRESGIPRDQLFITTKVWNDDQGYESALKAFEESRRKLGLEYLDLYLIHWPGKDKYIDTWRALCKLYEEGHTRAISVSNFHIHHLENLLASSDVVPAVNQVEFHPWLAQKPLRAFCKEKGIQFEAWSPQAQGQLLDHPILMEIAKKYGKSVSQIILRWDIQHGIVTIPKSVREELKKRVARSSSDGYSFFCIRLERQTTAIRAGGKLHLHAPASTKTILVRYG